MGRRERRHVQFPQSENSFFRRNNMLGTCLTRLAVFGYVIVQVASACPAQGTLSPSEANQLLVQKISDYLEIPENHVLKKPFWTTKQLIDKANTNLYYLDPHSPDTAGIVSQQLNDIYNRRSSSNDIELTAKDIRALIYVPDASSASGFKKTPIADTTLYRRIVAQFPARTIVAESWVVLLRSWHHDVYTEHKEQYLQALSEAAETIPKLADAFVKTHEAARGNPPATATPTSQVSAPSYVSSRMLMYMRMRRLRDIHNQRRREAYIRLQTR